MSKEFWKGLGNAMLATVFMLAMAYMFLCAMSHMAHAQAPNLPNCILVTLTQGYLPDGTKLSYTVEQPPQLQQPGVYSNTYQCKSVTYPGKICSWQSETCVYSNQ